MSIDKAMDRLRAANPAPDTRLLRDESVDLAALLSAIWQTSTDTQTQQPLHLEPPQGERRRGWLVAAAAFAIVMLVGGAVALTSRTDSIPSSDPEPGLTTISAAPSTTTQPATTTTEPGTTTTVGVSISGRIAFTTRRDGNDEVYVMDADGSNPTNLTNNPSFDGNPAWSPDGTRIAFTTKRDGNYEVYVMDADGSTQTNLTNNPSFDGAPAWSPDGTRIAFTTDRDVNREVYVMDVDGSNPINLTNNPGVDGVNTAAWSPDGTRIAYGRNEDDGTEIYVMDADGSNQVNLTNKEGNEVMGAWSSDGAYIAFQDNRDFRNGRTSGTQIYVMNADGSNQINVSNSPDGDGDFAPAWSPTP